MKITLKIKPLDTLFFKDGKPFTLGDETWADGIFPPSPSVIYGALRTLYFSSHPDELKKANLPEDPTKKLKITGIFLERNDQIYLPVPLDFLVSKDNSEQKSLLKIIKTHCISSAKTEYIAVAKDRMEAIGDNAVFGKIYYQKYLTGTDIEKLPCKTANDYLCKEPKVGIGRSGTTRTSEEGKLYRVDMQRFKDEATRILIELEGLDFSDSNKSFIKLGGEGKVAFYEKEEKSIQIKKPALEGKYFKVCLCTPAIFEKGWLPSWIDEKTHCGKFGNLKVKLLTAVVGKYISIGGFDMKNRKPKPMYKAVPSGSVYYFELQEGTQEDVIKTFHQSTISELDTAFQGFGIACIGKFTPETSKG